MKQPVTDLDTQWEKKLIAKYCDKCFKGIELVNQDQPYKKCPFYESLIQKGHCEGMDSAKDV